jgi:hypothetical protein
MIEKKPIIYDDQTLENLRRYYKIDSLHQILRYIKLNGLKRGVDE